MAGGGQPCQLGDSCGIRGPRRRGVAVRQAGQGGWERSGTGDTGQGEELGPGGRVVPQRTEQLGCDHAGVVRLDPTQRHAGVFGLQDNADTAGLQMLVQPLGDLLGEPLLHL